MIVKEGKKYQVKSENSQKKLGTYNSRMEALKRLRQIEWFKSHPKK